MAPKILVCDDRNALRELVRAALDEGEYDILEATDGEEALALARRTRPDVLILDVVMPGKSGLDVLEEVRSDPTLAAARVVLCTASTKSIDRSLASDLGADRYIAKPFSPLELAAAVEELVGERR